MALNLTMAGTQREVTLVNPWQNRGVSLEVSRNGQEILSGDKLEAGTPLSVELRNDTPQSVKLLALLGDALTELAKVEAGESRSDERTLDEDILLLVAAEKPDTETAGVYLPDGQAQPLQVCTADNGEAVADGAVLPTGTPLTIRLDNPNERMKLTVIHNGELLRNEIVAPTGTYSEQLTLAGDLIVLAREAAPEEITILNEAKLDANASYSISKVDVQGELFFRFREIEKTEYPVTVENHTSQTLTVGYVDDSSGTPVAVAIASGQSYPGGTLIGARAINTLTDRKLVLSAYVGGAFAGSAVVDAMSGTLEGANGFYVTLSGPASFVLDYGEAVTPQESETDGDCTVTVQNGAASANTDNAVNGLHVYEAPAGDDIADSASFAKGTEIELYVYNCASPVHLTVVHNGETVVDQDYPQMEAWVDDDEIEFHSFKLDGDLTVTTTALESYEEPEKSYTVHLTGDQAAGAEIYLDSDYVADGGSIPAGSHDIMVMGEGLVTVSVGGVQVGDAQDAGYAEFYGVDVTGDLTIDVSSAE